MIYLSFTRMAPEEPRSRSTWAPKRPAHVVKRREEKRRERERQRERERGEGRKRERGSRQTNPDFDQPGRDSNPHTL